MSRIRFEDTTPINKGNLDKLNNVVISPTEPTTGEEVWIDNTNKKIYTKNDSGVYEEFYNEGNMQPKNTALKCGAIGMVVPKTTTTFEILNDWGFLFLYNEWGNFGLYVYNMQTSGTIQMVIHPIKASGLITVTGEANTRNIKFSAEQIQCMAYNIYF